MRYEGWKFRYDVWLIKHQDTRDFILGCILATLTLW